MDFNGLVFLFVSFRLLTALGEIYPALGCLGLSAHFFKVSSMYKLINSRDLFWWSPLGKRVADWSMAMAWLWGRTPFIAGNLILALGGLWIWGTGSLQKPHMGIEIIAVSLVAYGTCFTLGLAGSIAGAVGGYYAPANETPHPFRSAFFRRFGRRAFAMWVYLALVSTPCFIALQNVGFVRLPIPMFLGLVSGLLALSLRYALMVAQSHAERITLD